MAPSDKKPAVSYQDDVIFPSSCETECETAGKTQIHIEIPSNASCSNEVSSEILCQLNSLLKLFSSNKTFQAVPSCLTVTSAGAWGGVGDKITQLRWYQTNGTNTSYVATTFYNETSQAIVSNVTADNTDPCSDTAVTAPIEYLICDDGVQKIVRVCFDGCTPEESVSYLLLDRSETTEPADWDSVTAGTCGGDLITNYALEDGGILDAISAKIPSLGQALAANSFPVVLTALQLSTLTPPAAITGYATESTLSSLNSKVTVVNTGAVVVSSSALPSGASTSALQTSGNTSLTSIDGKTPSLGQALAAASVPVVLTALQLSTLTPPAAITGFATESTLSSLNAKVTTVNTGAVVVSSSALPSGASTSALQTSGNASLTSIDSKTPALGQALAAASTPVVLTALQLSTLTPPAAITGYATEATLSTLNAKVTAVDTGAVVVSSSALPSGASTSGRQDTSNALLGDIRDYLVELQYANGDVRGTPLGFPIMWWDTSNVLRVTSAAKPLPTSVASLPLPSGAATESTLSTLNAKVTAVDTGAVVVSSSALPSGASTSANQSTANSSLSSIDGKTPALGQALAAASVPVVLTAAQITTLTPLSTVAVTQSGTWNIATVTAVTAITNPLPAGTSLLGSVAPAPVTAIVTETVSAPSTSSASLLSSNATRKAGWIKNIGLVDVYVSMSGTATTAKPTKLQPGETLPLLMPGGVVYTGAVAAITASGTGSVEVVEL